MSSQGALPEGLENFGLIETLLWTREGGYFLRDGHEARLKNSAGALGFAFEQKTFDDALARACEGDEIARKRVRLVLRRDGAFETSTAPCEPEPPGTIWRVGIARQRFDSHNSLLRHKTTLREIYENALAEAQAADGTFDEVIFLNERDEVCEGARTTIFVGSGDALWTPPLSCGLLPGVLRADLLRQGKAREKTLGVADLRENLFLGNSLRGLLRARLGD